MLCQGGRSLFYQSEKFHSYPYRRAQNQESYDENVLQELEDGRNGLVAGWFPAGNGGRARKRTAGQPNPGASDESRSLGTTRDGSAGRIGHREASARGPASEI